jgi:hypothetical protein
MGKISAAGIQAHKMGLPFEGIDTVTSFFVPTSFNEAKLAP